MAAYTGMTELAKTKLARSLAKNVTFANLSSLPTLDTIKKEIRKVGPGRTVFGVINPVLRTTSTSTVATSTIMKTREEYCLTPEYQDFLVNILVAALYIVISMCYITCGYRFFKSYLFSGGLILGGSIAYLLCLQENLLPDYGNYIVSLIAALLFGLITMLIQFVGIFVTGSLNGVIFGLSLLIMYSQTNFSFIPSTWLSIWILVFFGIGFGSTNIYYKKGISIFGMSLTGGAFLSASLDYLIYSGDTMKWLFETIKKDSPATPPCTFSWLLLALWPISAILGNIIQWAVTGTGIHHEESLAVLKRRSKAAPVLLTREQREEIRQRKYRYQYQVRTAHGDVISQSYVQALQQKTSSSEQWNAGGEFNTLQSDSTHLTGLASDAPQPDSDEDVNQIRACR